MAGRAAAGRSATWGAEGVAARGADGTVDGAGAGAGADATAPAGEDAGAGAGAEPVASEIHCAVSMFLKESPAGCRTDPKRAEGFAAPAASPSFAKRLPAGRSPASGS